jgi:hypothetical protein
MATTTTNYGFDVPTSSDLVKNGATQIALLGQDLDTFLFRPFTHNAIINGGMDIWQRGTSIAYGANTGVYTADRWTTLRTATPGGATVSRQASTLTGIQYCARVQRDLSNTSTAVMFFGTNLESADSYRFAGQTVTMSYYARAGANYSPTSSALAAFIYTGTGTDQNFISGFTGGAGTGSATATLTTSWQRFTITATIPSATTQIALYYSMTPTGTAGANDYFEVTGVQLEVGNQASPFIRAGGGTIQGELSACERYFQIVTGQMCSGSNTTTVYSGVNFRTQMRTAPSVALSAAMTITDAGADYTQSSASVSIVSSRANSTGAQISMPNFTSTTAHRPYSTTVTASQIQFSAEL